MHLPRDNRNRKKRLRPGSHHRKIYGRKVHGYARIDLWQKKVSPESRTSNGRKRVVGTSFTNLGSLAETRHETFVENTTKLVVESTGCFETRQQKERFDHWALMFEISSQSCLFMDTGGDGIWFHLVFEYGLARRRKRGFSLPGLVQDVPE